MSALLLDGFKEVIVNDTIDREIVEELRTNYGILVTITKDELEDKNYEYIYKDLEDVRLIKTLKHLLYYIVDTKKGDLHHLQKAIMVKSSEYLEFDISTKKNLELRVAAENGATEGKFDLAKRAKAANLDAIHDTVHEMAKDEARHGRGFDGLLARYFAN